MNKIKMLVLFMLLSEFNIKAQVISANLFERKWNSFWIATTLKADHEYGVSHFRKAVTLANKPTTFIVHVSADNRYKLFVNGVLVSLGPARSDLYHWKYETVDLAPYLKAGENIIASVVWNYGAQKPLAQISFQTAFIIQGNTPQEEIINTNKTWKCLRDTSYSALVPDLVNTYYVMGPGEHIDYNRYPSGWEQAVYDDAAWKPAAELSNALPKGVFFWNDNWMLVPNTLPQMERTPQRFTSLREVTGITVAKSFPLAKTAITIPGKTKVVMLLDQGNLTNAYPVVEFSKGSRAVISIGYAEALYVNEGNARPRKQQNVKGNRNEVSGKRFVGVNDVVISNGSPSQKFTSLDFRTFRYVKVEIETADEPLIINDISSIFTGYPFKRKSTFTAADPLLANITETGWRTARLCATETYTDCPYYEQLQYVGDTRIQCIVSMFNSDDDRLVRNAITQIDNSRLAEGITQSRFPSSQAQHIPTFSLWWIGMLNDYYRYGKEPDFIKQFLPGERQVLWFFNQHQAADGRLKNPPYWEFTDWANQGGWSGGVPPMGSDDCAAPIDLQLLLAYQTAAALEENLGMKEYANQYHQQAAALRTIIHEKYWDANRQLYADNVEKKYFSQHTNTLAILTQLVNGDSATNLAHKIISDTTLTQATIYFKYYVNQALAKAGLGNTYLDHLDVWKESLKLGLTTWPEDSDLKATRSDCHAWGASPNIEFFRIVLGIDSDAAGFSKIKIEPHLGNLKQVSGTMPHPKGEISASYNLDSKGKWHVVLTIPAQTPASFLWKGNVYPLQAGTNTFTF